MSDDLRPQRLYAGCMEEIKLRIGLVRAITSGALSVAGREDFSAELACIQLRKTLELLAFASLVANKDKYAAAHSDFAGHWNAKRLLANLARIHPYFYPTPIALDQVDSAGIKNFRNVSEPYLSREDFVFLYDTTSQALHSRNPFRTDPAVIDFRVGVAEWVGRIQTLLNMHYMRLVDSDTLWVVIMKSPDDGKVHVMRAEARA